MPSDAEDALLLADPTPRHLGGDAGGDAGAGSGAEGAGRGEGAAARAALSADAPSVLDAYGEELTAVMTPVSITCVALRLCSGCGDAAPRCADTLHSVHC